MVMMLNEKLTEKIKKAGKKAVLWFQVSANVIFGLGAASPQAEAAEAKKEVKVKNVTVDNKTKIDKKGKTFSFAEIIDFSADVLDEEKLADYLCSKKITMADLLASGMISKNELEEFKYSKDDVAQMNESSLMDGAIKNLLKNAKSKSTEMCAQSVRKAWFYATSKEKNGLKNKINGVFNLSKNLKNVEPENIWCMTERGYATDWIDAVRENSRLLLPIGVAKTNGGGNIDFSALDEAKGLICVAPGKNDEPGHAFVLNDKKQYSDFCNDWDWICKKMGRDYKNEVRCFVPADARAPKSLVLEMVKEVKHLYNEQGLSVRELCENFGVKPNNFLIEGKIFSAVMAEKSARLCEKTQLSEVVKNSNKAEHVTSVVKNNRSGRNS